VLVGDRTSYRVGEPVKLAMGIDIGGTFTDGVVIDQDNLCHVFKTPTIPEDPAAGLFACIETAAGFFGVPLGAFLHSLGKLTFGTTLATNALIEGKVAPTGLITTKGFRDTLPIARVGREYLPIDLQFERPPALIPRRMIEEVTERVDRAGVVVTPLNLEEAEQVADRLVAKGAESVAICFLWSFANPVHELKVAELVRRRHPGVYVTVSAELAPVIGEYERTATVVMNSALGPRVREHLGRLSTLLGEKGLESPLLIMQSNGGLTRAEEASLRPVMLLNSGPVGGVVASKALGELLGYQDLICIDMGGTSFDVSPISRGEYASSLTSRVHQHNMCVPSVDVHSIGAGGGSIAWQDMGRVLKVGPHSAGADPGPACYGKGGEEPTVTDADVVLGRLDPAYFLGGEMVLDEGRSRTAIEKRVARPLGMDTVAAAAGICQVVDSAMADAVRLISVRKGYDPRDYVMVAFGGAGPAHAGAIAREVGVHTFIVPYVATAQSAFGIVASDIIHSFARSELMDLQDLERMNRGYREVEAQGLELLRKEGVPESAVQVLHQADMRYRGQDHEITVALPVKLFTEEDIGEIKRRFEEKYQSLYGPGTIFRQARIEVVTLRADIIGGTSKPSLAQVPEGGPAPAAAWQCQRPVYFPESGGFITTQVYDGDRLLAGNLVDGPAVVQYRGTTAIIHPGQQARVDGYRNLIVSC
jgi:N-methylhydantoinase A